MPNGSYLREFSTMLDGACYLSKLPYKFNLINCPNRARTGTLPLRGSDAMIAPNAAPPYILLRYYL